MPAELVEIKRHHPSTGILVVLPHLDGTLLLQAMRAGASECVAEPITRDELERAFARIAAQRPAPRRGDVFAVIGAKGGVGATTVAVNVATILNKLRASSTLLMDLHLTYGDAATFLGAEPRFSTLDALENMHRLDAAFLQHADHPDQVRPPPARVFQSPGDHTGRGGANALADRARGNRVPVCGARRPAFRCRRARLPRTGRQHRGGREPGGGDGTQCGADGRRARTTLRQGACKRGRSRATTPVPKSGRRMSNVSSADR